jgi:hypothetical protein
MFAIEDATVRDIKEDGLEKSGEFQQPHPIAPKADFRVVCAEGIARALCRVGKGQPIMHMRRVEGVVSDTQWRREAFHTGNPHVILIYLGMRLELKLIKESLHQIKLATSSSPDCIQHPLHHFNPQDPLFICCNKHSPHLVHW